MKHENYEEALKRIKNGEDFIKVEKELRLKNDKFVNWLRDKGENNIGMYRSEKIELCKILLETTDKSLTEICEELYLCRTRVNKILKQQGVEIVNKSIKYSYDESFFENIDTEEKAYWLGSLYADGCISFRYSKNGNIKNGNVDLSLKDTDVKHLEKFKKSLKTEAKISYRIVYLKETRKQYRACRVKIGNTKIAKDLANKGCGMNKTCSLTFPSKDIVPDFLLFHFVRGYIDGDGYLGFYEKENNKAELRFGAVGTKIFLTGLRERTGWEFNIYQDERSKDENVNNAFEITSIPKKMEYLKQLYETSSIFLDRKKEIYLKALAVFG